MNLPGRVQNGVVVLEGGATLPEGAAVIVTYPAPAGISPSVPGKRVELPLVRRTAAWQPAPDRRTDRGSPGRGRGVSPTLRVGSL